MSQRVANVNLNNMASIDVSHIDYFCSGQGGGMSAKLTSMTADVTLECVADDFLRSFGRAVRRLRQERGMTQAELASRLGLGRTSITNLEKGHQSPPLSMLPDIASALGIDPLQLVADTVRGDASTESGALAATVHDEELRRWAGQVITSSGQPSGSTLPLTTERRPA
jgi:transcriptional regulator with XRE-family HTH domain